MSNRIDQFFKDKLADVRQAPGADAWSKIESGLTKKNKYVIVWRIAAVFALLSVLFASLYLTRPAASPGRELVNENPVKNQPTTPLPDTLSQKPLQENNLLTTVKEKPQEKPKRENIKRELIQNQAALPEQEKKEDTPNEPLQELKIEEQVVVAEVVKTEKPVVIEYTLESIAEEKQVQTAQEEKSGLKKLWDAAKDVKNGNSDLGLLRDAKNDLFAFEFRKDKAKRN